LVLRLRGVLAVAATARVDGSGRAGAREDRDDNPSGNERRCSNPVYGLHETLFLGRLRS
jgi:hypothetical protein